ncbi:MAG TPA: hypothetical protein PLU39_11190 [Armatimonadota bacterium]|nr:hypothetical protein [Armatimonadota bacterium]HOJ20865.1 hypothetical protein [Armatimonadota bacterium]HOM81043.1 hypothetical protein [Armatimonadota bacterium]HPO73482.1 hypothetical protein [Armatimonadota bacterium]HPT98424.1 hypothetical protein [Armatimonadota bacterium]
MKRRIVITALLLGIGVATRGAVAGPLPAAVGNSVVARVDPALAKEITAAQDGKGQPFTIALDGAQAEPLAISPVRLRDYQNVYYRVTGKPGAWQLEESGFSPVGADEESRQIRRALGITDEKQVFFLPGREYLLLPAKSRAVIRVAGKSWSFRVSGSSAGERRPMKAILVRAGDPISLRLAEAVSSAATREGSSVRLTVAEPVMADGLIAVAQGTVLEARVIRVKRPSFPGNPGMVTLELGSVEAVDGTEIPLAVAGSPRVTFSARASFLLSRGQHVTLAEGTPIAARAARAQAVLAPK